MKPVDNTCFPIGMFNVRRLTKTEKQEKLVRDIGTYYLDVCCLQEKRPGCRHQSQET